MTDKETLEFFNKVKGCKIRRTSWDKGDYFIPKRLEGNGIMYGTFYSSGKYEIRVDSRTISGGFKETTYIPYKWEYVIDMDKELENL